MRYQDRSGVLSRSIACTAGIGLGILLGRSTAGHAISSVLWTCLVFVLAAVTGFAKTGTP
jgi:hypothetical protein